MKRFVTTLIGTLLINSPIYAGLITHNDYSSGATITAAGQNTNENAVFNEFNGNIDDTNIKASAGIAVSKLATVTASKAVTTDSTGHLVGFGAYVLYQSSQTLVSVSSATTVVNTLVPTQISVTLTPRSTASIFKVSLSGAFEMTLGGSSAWVTIERNATNLLGSSGGCMSLEVSGTQRSSCSIQLYDSPATVSALTYKIYIATEGGTVTWGTAAGTPVTTILTVDEYSI